MLNHLLNPQSIAIVGASRDRSKIGAQILANILKSDYKGKVYPVNNQETHLTQGIPTFPSLSAIADPIDLAIIVIPTNKVEPVIDEAISKKVKAIIIISAGFKEVSSAGAELENRIAQKCQASEITLLGPNCLGLIVNPNKYTSAGNSLNASFAPFPTNSSTHQPTNTLSPRPIIFLSQSGAFGTAALDWGNNHNLHFSLFVSLGNKAGVSENDFLNLTAVNFATGVNANFFGASAAGEESSRAVARITNKENSEFQNQFNSSLMHQKNSHLHQSPQNTSLFTQQVLALYLEDFKNGHSFINQAHELSKNTPIILLKPGKSAQAKSAIQSHTGSLATDDKVIDAACEQAGIIRAHTSQDFFNLLQAFSFSKQLKGNKIAIITNAGGPGILATDHLAENKLELAKLSEQTQQQLVQLLPRSANTHDPIDILGDANADRYYHALKTVINEPQVDGILVILTPQSTTEIAKTAHIITQIQSITNKPIFSSFIGGTLVQEGIQSLTQHCIPTYHFPEQALKSMGALYQYHIYQQRNQLSPVPVSFGITNNKQSTDQTLESNQITLKSSTALLNQLSLSTPPYAAINTINEALIFAKKWHYPLVLKLDSPNIAHRTELHAVHTNLGDEQQLQEAFNSLTISIRTDFSNSSTAPSIIIQPHLSGLELFLGMKRDPQFGPVILFGTGGIYTEIFNDIATGIAPLTRNEALVMVKSTKIGQILQGARGRDPFDLHNLAVILCQLGSLAIANPNIRTIDLNPVILTHDDKLFAVDPKIST